VQALDPLNNVVAWVIMRIHAVLGAAFGPATGLAWGLSIVFLVMFFFFQAEDGIRDTEV
jgi:hypothetical protein